MTIISKSRDFSLQELYTLTKDPKISKLKEHVGEVLEVTGYILRDELCADGKDTVSTLTLELAGGGAVASNSPTVQRSFHEILDIYEFTGDKPFPMFLAVFTDTARKSGREYINIRLMGDQH